MHKNAFLLYHIELFDINSHFRRLRSMKLINSIPLPLTGPHAPAIQSAITKLKMLFSLLSCFFFSLVIVSNWPRLWERRNCCIPDCIRRVYGWVGIACTRAQGRTADHGPRTANWHRLTMTIGLGNVFPPSWQVSGGDGHGRGHDGETVRQPWN